MDGLSGHRFPLWSACVVLAIMGLVLVGCQIDGGEADESEVMVEEGESMQSSDGSTLKVNLIQSEDRSDTVQPQESDRVERREMEVAVEQPQHQNKRAAKSNRKSGRGDVYADRPDPFAESRVEKLESSLEPFEAVQLPQQAMNGP